MVRGERDHEASLPGRQHGSRPGGGWASGIARREVLHQAGPPGDGGDASCCSGGHELPGSLGAGFPAGRSAGSLGDGRMAGAGSAAA
eukprot:7716000-Heterocapsa_arctica.AAC.1